MTASLALKSYTAVVFSAIDLAEVAAPEPPEGPEMLGAVSSTLVTLMVTVAVSVSVPSASTAETVRVCEVAVS